jgi:protein subunit release factor A
LNAEPTAALLGELGVHRAQWIEPLTGRIETLKVRVELLRTIVQRGGGASNEEIIRTYNYPLRRCTHHPSGRVVPLDDVLAGAG